MSEEKPIRVLIAKPGLDGHDRGAKVVALALRDAGMEVIYTGLHRTIEEIVAAAVQEDVDVIGLSILSGAHLPICAKLFAQMRDAGIAHVPVIVGGNIPLRDHAKLRALGIAGVFATSTALSEIANAVRAITEGKQVKSKKSNARLTNPREHKGGNMQSQMVQVGGERIAVYQSKGKGAAALLIHGNSCSSRSYQHQLDSALGDEFRIVAMDLPGHGQSANASDPTQVYNMPGYARVVAGVAEQLGLTRAVIVGWSLGGHIALEATPLLPNAAGWMIFGTPPLAFPPAMAEAFLPNPAMGAAFKPDLSEEEIAGFASAFFKPGTPVPALFLEDIRRTDGQARAQMAASIAPGGYADEIEIVAKLSAPLAILQGEHEQLVNLAYIKNLKMPTLWRGATQMVTDAGHASHWEQPEKFNALLKAFLIETSKT